MRKIILGIVIVFGLGFAFVTIRHFFFHEENHEGHGEESATQYQCPMHPHVLSDKPGSCPICGMKLVPVENKPSSKEGSAHPHPSSTIQLSPERRQWIGLKTAIVIKKPLMQILRLPGRVAYDRELYITENEYVSSLQWGGGDDLRNIIEKKMKRLGISNEELAHIKKTKKADDSLFLPKEGETFWIYASIYEADIESVAPGMEAMVELSSNRSITRTGVVRGVTPILDESTRTAEARIAAPLFGAPFKPQMYVNVTLKKDLGEELALPKDAVIDNGVEKIVFVDLGEGFLEPRPVTLGARAGDDFPVVEGLAEGEKVVTSAQFLLDSEAVLQQALKKFGTLGKEGVPPAGGHQH